MHFTLLRWHHHVHVRHAVWTHTGLAEHQQRRCETHSLYRLPRKAGAALCKQVLSAEGLHSQHMGPSLRSNSGIAGMLHLPVGAYHCLVLRRVRATILWLAASSHRQLSQHEHM